MERAGCVLIFAIFYLLSTISGIVSTIVSFATWDMDGEDVTVTVVDDDEKEEVEVSKGAIIAVAVVIDVAFIALQVYFAACLFSLYYQLKNKNDAQKRDAELAFVGKNTS